MLLIFIFFQKNWSRIINLYLSYFPEINDNSALNKVLSILFTERGTDKINNKFKMVSDFDFENVSQFYFLSLKIQAKMKLFFAHNSVYLKN